jgi:hypothetical protein
MVVQTNPPAPGYTSDATEHMRGGAATLPLSPCGFEVLRALVLGLALRGEAPSSWAFQETGGAQAGAVDSSLLDELVSRGFVCLSAQITEVGRAALLRRAEQARADIVACLTLADQRG